MERYFLKQNELNTRGDIINIYDNQNTEPVCTVFYRYHPYAVEIILKALNEANEKREK